MNNTPIPNEAQANTRLNKRMAALGLCSRREADAWVAKGWVRVNGELAEMGMRVSDDDRIEVDRHANAEQAQRVTVLINKPMGYVSGQPEDDHEPAVVLFQPRNRWAEDRSQHAFAAAHGKGLAPAGRLDIDSTGLLVMTQDGRIARQLIGENSDVEKEYLVRVAHPAGGQQGSESSAQATFSNEQLQRLQHGLRLDERALRRAKVDWMNPDQLRFVLQEGRKRQIRRMCELVGLQVLALKRVRIGRVMLGHLPIGQWRYLANNERF